MRILITGVAGFIGSHLAERLVEAGHDVVGLDCFTDYYSRALKDLNAAAVRARGVEILELDLAEDPLAPALDGVEIVYHLAAQPGISGSTPFADYARNNLQATWRLLEATMEHAAPRLFVNVATSGNHASQRRIGEEVFGHLLDPRTGRPAPFEGSVTVVTRDAAMADSLATALFVLGPDAGLALARRTPDLEAVYVTRTGVRSTLD